MRRVLLLLTASLVLVVSAFAQERTVSGKVTSGEDGTIMPGVNVVLKGTTIGTVTDAEGNYKLNVPASGGILIFSFIGAKTTETEIGSRNVVDLVLQSDATELSELVVTGYSDISQKKLVSSVASVNGEAIQNVPMPDINQIIQGRATGVFSTSPSGQPGAAQRIRVRGTGSISAGRDPLYVIDGVIIQNGDITQQAETTDILANINPNDIENITVLKDASASALYGARAANGVILITTKRGKSGSSSITARAQYGVTLKNTGNFKFLSGREIWEYDRLVLANSGNSEAAIDALRPSSMLDSTFNWVDAAFRQGKTQNYEIQAQGGDDKTRYFVSGSYFEQDGILIESGFKRYSLRTNVDQKVNDKIDLSMNLNVSYTQGLNAVAGNRFASPLLGAFATTPLQNPINPNTGQLFTGREDNYIGFTGDNFLYSAPLNPVTNNNLRTIAKLAVGYNILDNVRLSQTIAADVTGVREKAFFDPTTNDGFDDNGSITESYSDQFSYTSQTKLSGNWLFADVHSVDALGVFELQRVAQSNFGTTGIGLASGKLQTLNSTATPQSVFGSDTDFSFLSYLGQVNYGYNDKYYASVSFRRDGSSRFGADVRYANFASIGASWRIIDEGFMSGVTFLSDLKLRASYGSTGNSELANFGSLGLYGFNAAYNGNPGSTPTQIANPLLSWETSYTTNLALDFGLFDNRIKGSVDVYDRTSENLLQNVPVSSTSGFTTAAQNLGKIQNRGLEFQITTDNLNSKDVRWTTDFNITLNRNKILELNNGEDIPNGSQLLREGEHIRSWYLQKWAGVNPANGTPLWYRADGTLTGTYAQAGRFLVGNPEPRYLGGLNNTVSYKGFSLNAFFYFAVGHEVYNQSRAFIESDGARFGFSVWDKAATDFWTEPGDIASRPQPRVGGNNASNSASTRYLENGSYLRLRNVVLSYNIPSSIVSKAGFKNARVYAQGQNLLTITEYTGFDPEMDESGNEFFRYPVGKSYTFGVELTF
jgi:TonB-linked SusC/RagA family outer membrane protein